MSNIAECNLDRQSHIRDDVDIQCGVIVISISIKLTYQLYGGHTVRIVVLYGYRFNTFYDFDVLILHIRE
jgi:hypothetical protein